MLASKTSICCILGGLVPVTRSGQRGLYSPTPRAGSIRTDCVKVLDEKDKEQDDADDSDTSQSVEDVAMPFGLVDGRIEQNGHQQTHCRAFVSESLPATLDERKHTGKSTDVAKIAESKVSRHVGREGEIDQNKLTR